jgi:hypothetical protein
MLQRYSCQQLLPAGPDAPYPLIIGCQLAVAEHLRPSQIGVDLLTMTL